MICAEYVRRKREVELYSELLDLKKQCNRVEAELDLLRFGEIISI